MKTLLIIVSVLTICVSGLQAKYDGCVREGISTKPHINMSEKEFQRACKTMSSKDRYSMAVNANATAPADSGYAKRMTSKRFYNSSIKEVYDECKRTRYDSRSRTIKERADCSRATSFMMQVGLKRLSKKNEKQTVQTSKVENTPYKEEEGFGVTDAILFVLLFAGLSAIRIG